MTERAAEPVMGDAAARFRRLEAAFKRISVAGSAGPEARRRAVEIEARESPDLADELAALVAHDPGTGDSSSGTDRLAAAESVLGDLVGTTRPDTGPPSEVRLDDVLGNASARGDGEGEYHEPRQIGHYRLERELGAGSSGVVHLATDEHDGSAVALKVLHTLASGPRGFARFRREAAILQRLDHPGIAAIRDAGSIDTPAGPQGWLAMEYVDGTPITRWAMSEGLDREATLELVASVADAIAHAHRLGVVHRDIKPANVFVRADGVPKVLDLGAARFLEPDDGIVHTETGQVIGTVPYMAPEQFEGIPERIGPAADVYALGVLTYRLLVGRLPLDLAGRPIAEAARIARDEEPSSLGTVDRGLRGSVSAVVGTALAKNPDRRYPDAGAFADDLRRAIAREPVVARPPSWIAQLRRSARRNHRLITSAAAVFALLLAAVIVAATFAVAAERERRQEVKDREAEATRRVEAERLRDLADAEREIARQQAASANLVAAESAARAGEMSEAQQRLDAVPTEYRGWTWDHLSSVTDRSEFGPLELPVATGLAAVTPLDDGRFVVASHGFEGRLFVVDDREIAFDTPAMDWINVVISGRSDDEIIAGGHRGVVAYDLSSESARRLTPIADGARTLRLGSDGQTLIVGGLRGDVIWVDLETGERRGLRRFSTLTRSSVQVLPWSRPTAEDGTPDPPGRVATLAIVDGDGGFVTWCDPDGSVGHRTLWIDTDLGVVRAAADAPAERLVTTSILGVITVREAPDWEVSASWSGGRGGSEPVDFLDDGSIVLGSMAGITRYAPDGTVIRSLAGHHDLIRTIRRIGPERIVSVSYDGTLRTWDFAAPDEPLMLDHPRHVKCVEFVGDGRRLVTGGGRHPTPDGRVRTWDATSGELIATHEPTLYEVHMMFVMSDPDGGADLVIGVGKDIAMWHESDPEAIWVVDGPAAPWWLMREPGTDPERGLFVIGYHGVVRHIELRTGVETELATFEMQGPKLVDLEDGTVLAAGRIANSEAMRLVRFDPTDGTVISTHDHDGAFPEDALLLPGPWGGDDDDARSLAIAGSDGILWLFDARTLDPVARVAVGAARLETLAVHPQSSAGGWRLLVGGNDRTLRVLRPGDTAPIATLVVQDGTMTDVAVSPDGSVVATASFDRTARVRHRGLRLPEPSAAGDEDGTVAAAR